MFQIGDKVVHPMHGAGIIDSIVQQKVGGAVRDYFVLKLPKRSMVVMVPKENCKAVGLRPVIDSAAADRVLAAIPGIQVEMTRNWNHRYRENLERLKSGDLLEVAWVIKGLTLRDQSRGLSTGERKMLLTAKEILLSELVLSQSVSYEAAELALDTALA